MHFSWIVEFPMFAFDAEEKHWAAMHHPFTAPRPQDIELLKTDPGRCRAQAYDLVINGYEAGGGTIRIHDQEMQQQVFELLGIDSIQARERFGFLLDALQFGAPPHGGIALGIDRCVMLFGGLTNIRDCIAFPKTQKATDLMTEAPGPVDPAQLRELGIKRRGEFVSESPRDLSFPGSAWKLRNAAGRRVYWGAMRSGWIGSFAFCSALLRSAGLLVGPIDGPVPRVGVRRRLWRQVERPHWVLNPLRRLKFERDARFALAVARAAAASAARPGCTLSGPTASFRVRPD